MDMISRLPDAALVKIISNLPTKTAISTSILSKRWECLWMWLPKLEFHYLCSHLQRFIHRRLPLHKALVLENLCFTFKVSGYGINKPENIKPLIVVAVSRCIRELEITCFYCNPGIKLPTSLFTNKSLVILKLMGGGIFLEVIPRNVCLASLKTLKLSSVKYACEKSLQWLLSICPVLEDLFIDMFLCRSNKMKFIVIMPSLLRLSLDIPYISDDVEGFVINTPSLEYFKLVDKCNKRDYYMIHYMPKLVEAYVDVRFPDVQCFIGSMTSVNHLTLCHCLGSFHKEVVYEDGCVFNQLEHIKLCVCSWHKSNLLNPLLNDSPYLQSLELFRKSGHEGSITCWNEPTMVPECLLWSLQIFKWSSYSGSRAERDIAVYILRNARRLKTTTITSEEAEVPKHEMLKELALSSRASATCKLIFN